MKKYNNFLNEDRQDDAKKWLLDKPYIKEDQISKDLLVVSTSDYNYPECLTNISKRKFTTLNYSNLMRYFLYSWLYVYKGENKLLQKIRNVYISNTQTKPDFIRPFSQIPTNIKVLKTLNIDSYDTKTTDYLVLGKLDAWKSKLFTEENVLEWYNIVYGLTIKADEGEKRIIDFINDNKIFNSARKANTTEDKSGIDVVAINSKNEEIYIQVKEPSKTTDISKYWSKRTWKNNGVDTPYYIILIKNTDLDLKNYNKTTDGKLIWKFLFLIDNKNNKLYSINSHSIQSITKDENQNVWINMTLTEEWLPKMVKEYTYGK